MENKLLKAIDALSTVHDELLKSGNIAADTSKVLLQVSSNQQDIAQLLANIKLSHASQDTYGTGGTGGTANDMPDIGVHNGDVVSESGEDDNIPSPPVGSQGEVLSWLLKQEEIGGEVTVAHIISGNISIRDLTSRLNNDAGISASRSSVGRFAKSLKSGDYDDYIDFVRNTDETSNDNRTEAGGVKAEDRDGGWHVG